MVVIVIEYKENLTLFVMCIFKLIVLFHSQISNGFEWLFCVRMCVKNMRVEIML